MWWQVLFWALLVPVLIVLGIIYGTNKKLYKLFQVLATFTYVITVAYVIDVFSLGRNWVLGLLVFSAILMIAMGYSLTRPRKQKKRSKAYLYGLGALLVVMLLLIVLGSLRSGLIRDEAIVQSLPRSVLVTEGKMPEQGFSVGSITYTNTFPLPIVSPDQYFVACLHDAQQDAPYYIDLQVRVNGKYRYEEYQEPFTEVMPGETKTLQLAISGAPLPVRPETVNATTGTDLYRQYDALLLASSSDTALSCETLVESKARGILILNRSISLTD